MNRIVDDIQTEQPAVVVGPTQKRRSVWLALAAMLVYPALKVGTGAQADALPVAMVLSAVAWFLAIYLVYAITSLAYRRFTYLLWSGIAGGAVLGYLVSGIENLWFLLVDWTLIFAAAVVVGRLTQAGRRQMTVYVIGLLLVAVLSVAEFAPRWPALMAAADTYRAALLHDFQTNLTTSGYSAEAAQSYLDLFGKVLTVTTRLLPASLVAGAIAQFSVGYLWFVSREVRTLSGQSVQTSFVTWKMPFAAIPLVIVAIIARLLGSDTVTVVADNALAVLGLFYCVTGLALVEFYMKKLGLSLIMRVLFYLLLFITQLIGLVVVVLLGFVDSFADWRKVDPPRISLDNQ